MKKSHRELLPLIEKAKGEIKKSKTIRDMCQEHGVDVSVIDLMPVAFADLDVSARTDKGVIYFNSELIDNFLEEHLHYFSHELMHVFQQCYGDGPTTGGQGEDYLDNEYEIEGFQTQTEFLSETEDDGVAKEYIEKVLDHHDVPKEERKERKDELLNIALQNDNLVKDAGLFTPPKELVDKIFKNIRSAYASAVLLKAEKRLKIGEESNKVWGSLESEDEKGNVTGVFEDIGYLFFEALDDLEPGQETTFNVGFYPETKLLFSKLAIKGYLSLNEPGEEYTLYIDGGYDSEDKPIKIVEKSDKDTMKKHLSEAHKALDKYITDLGAYKNKLIDNLLEGDREIEYKKLIQKCREQGGTNKAWSSMWVLSLEEILDTLKDSPHIKEFDKSDMLRKLEGIWPPVVTIELEYTNKIEMAGGTNISGLWSYGPMALILAVGDLKEYDSEFYDSKIFDIRLFAVLETAYHETIHMLQFLLRDLTGVWHGLPSKSIREPTADPVGRLKKDVIEQYKSEEQYSGDPRDNYGRVRWEFEKKMIDETPTGRVHYALTDVEFYTNLNEAVNFFNKASEGESPNLRLEHSKLWVGLPNRFVQLATEETGSAYAESDSFFMWLKDQAPEKWQKAVKEFFKATNTLI